MACFAASSNRLGRDARGATLVEYLIVVALLGVIGLAALRIFGGKLVRTAAAEANCVASLVPCEHAAAAEAPRFDAGDSAATRGVAASNKATSSSTANGAGNAATDSAGANAAPGPANASAATSAGITIAGVRINGPFLSGAFKAFGSDMVLGANGYSPSPAERDGATLGHSAAAVVGIGAMVLGGGMATGGGTLEVASVGLATPVAVPAAVAGGALAVHGFGQTATALKNLGRIYKEGGSGGSGEPNAQSPARGKAGGPAKHDPLVSSDKPKVVCAWCKKTLREGPEPISHGICDGCMKDMIEQSK